MHAVGEFVLGCVNTLKEPDAMGAHFVPALKIGNEVMIGWNLK